MGRVHGRTERTARLLKIQMLLWQNPQGLEIEEIARKCSISNRTAYRDLKSIETELGVPIWEEGSKRGISEGYFLPPITFTQSEAMTIFLAVRLLQGYSYLYNPHITATFLKINTVIPQPIKKQIQNTIEYLENLPRDERRIRNLDRLFQAWTTQHKVKILFQRLTDQDTIKRIFDIYFIQPASFGRSSYLIGYCHYLNEITSLKVDRIVGEVVIEPETYYVPDTFNAIEYLTSSWGIYGDEELKTVRLHFSPFLSKGIKDTIWHPSQKIETLDDESIIMTFKVKPGWDFRAWILGYGDDVEILEPAILRQQIAQIAKSMVNKYTSSNEL